MTRFFDDPSLQRLAEAALARHREANSGRANMEIPRRPVSTVAPEIAEAIAAATAELNADPDWADLASRVRRQSYDEVLVTMQDFANSAALQKLIATIQGVIQRMQSGPLSRFAPKNIGEGQIIAALQETPKTAVTQVLMGLEIDPLDGALFLGCATPIDNTGDVDPVIYIGVSVGMSIGEGGELDKVAGVSPLAPADIPGHSVSASVQIGAGLGSHLNKSFAGTASFNCVMDEQRHFPDILPEQWVLTSGTLSGEALMLGATIDFSLSIRDANPPEPGSQTRGSSFTVLRAITCYQKQDTVSDHDEIYIEVVLDGDTDNTLTYPFTVGSKFSIQELNEHSSDDQDDGWQHVATVSDTYWLVGMPLTFNNEASVTLYQGNNRLGTLTVHPSDLPAPGQGDKNFILDIPSSGVMNDIDYVLTLTSPYPG